MVIITHTSTSSISFKILTFSKTIVINYCIIQIEHRKCLLNYFIVLYVNGYINISVHHINTLIIYVIINMAIMQVSL